jgi:hypothetical protein
MADTKLSLAGRAAATLPDAVAGLVTGAGLSGGKGDSGVLVAGPGLQGDVGDIEQGVRDGRGGAVAEPPQPQQRLPEAGQCRLSRPSGRRRSAALGSAAAALLRNEPGQFRGHVKRGTIGNHVEPPAEGDLVVRFLLLVLHAHFPAVRFVRVSAWLSPLGRDKAACPNLYCRDHLNARRCE